MNKQNAKNLFLEKFYKFLNNEKHFFAYYKKYFIVNFLQLLKKNYPQIKIKKSTKEMCSDFYEALFINPSFKTENFKPIIEIKNFLKENNINTDILNKTFLLMCNSFIKNIFPYAEMEKLKNLTILLDFYHKFLSSQINENLNSQSIPPLIIKIFNQKSNIFLFGVYKGVPLSTKTKIVSVDNAQITLRANNYQLIASNFQKEIYLLDLKTNKTFKAFIKDSNFYEKTLVLSDIKEIKRTSLKRNYIRVQPKETINATISVNKSYSATIYDISLKGISIITKNSIPIQIGETALIEFNLEINGKIEHFAFSSELRSISKYNKKYRYHFYFEPSLTEENRLEKYITKREKEIISELNEYLNKEFIEF